MLRKMFYVGLGGGGGRGGGLIHISKHFSRVSLFFIDLYLQ